MNSLNYVFVNIIETLLRMLPFPGKTGLIKIGNPDRNSPVFLTCNYHLTVERVKRALKGMDAFLLVANSRGVNVWCAATGGLFTNHDVISALKTSGIEGFVEHRNVIIPQLAATGIEPKTIQKKTGWKSIWGPVYAKDIHPFIKNNLKKTLQMREVRFPLSQRIEMAIAWAFPISVILSLIMIPLWQEAIFLFILLIWGLSIAIFLTFPFYRHLLSSEGRRIGFVFFDFGRGGFQLMLWGILMLCLVVFKISIVDFEWISVFHWGLIFLIVVFIVSLDLMGSTPIYKSGLHEDRLLKIVFNKKKCKGAGLCEEVCPRNCYEVNKVRNITTIPRANQCVQCSACIVQCPFDALYFRNPKKEIILPETLRKFKLNMMGKRSVRAS